MRVARQPRHGRRGRDRHDAFGHWARAWYFWTGAAFLAAYRKTAAGTTFLPATSEELSRVLDACLLQKAVYELRYELNNRPDWVHLPLAALDDLLGEEPDSPTS